MKMNPADEDYRTINICLDAQRRSFVQYMDTIGPLLAKMLEMIVDIQDKIDEIERILKDGQ